MTTHAKGLSAMHAQRSCYAIQQSQACLNAECVLEHQVQNLELVLDSLLLQGCRCTCLLVSLFQKLRWDSPPGCHSS